MHPHAKTLTAYFEAMSRSDKDAILALFAEDGRVTSPFLGDMDAKSFFAKLTDASANSTLTILDILIGADGTTAAGRFSYDWTLKSGDNIVFEGIDHFAFDTGGRITRMTIYYDTHPVREDVGDKYA